MRLVDLEPVWLMKGGKRIGFTFLSPTKREYRQSCFATPPSISEQVDIFDAAHGDHQMVQPCNPKATWTIAGGIETADFATVTVTPSLDGSAGGLWHGFIRNGVIEGGI